MKGHQGGSEGPLGAMSRVGGPRNKGRMKEGKVRSLRLYKKLDL